MTLERQKSAVWKAEMESELLKRLGWLLFRFGMSKHKFLNHSSGSGIPGEYSQASTVGLQLGFSCEQTTRPDRVLLWHYLAPGPVSMDLQKVLKHLT